MDGCAKGSCNFHILLGYFLNLGKGYEGQLGCRFDVSA